MDTTELHQAHNEFLDAAAQVADAGGSHLAAPDGEWNFEQILAHVALVDAASLAVVASVAAGANTVFDNRVLNDDWTIEQTIARSDGTALTDRVRTLGDALCAVAGDVLNDAELDTAVPTLLVSNDQLLVNEPTTVRALVEGLAGNELPGHTAQLLALLP